jgi:hypothetical protein
LKNVSDMATAAGIILPKHMERNIGITPIPGASLHRRRQTGSTTEKAHPYTAKKSALAISISQGLTYNIRIIL